MASRTEHGFKIVKDKETKHKYFAELVLCEVAGTLDGQVAIVCVGEVKKQRTSGKPIVTFPMASTPQEKEAQWLLAKAICEWLNLILPDTMRTMAVGSQIPDGFGEKYVTVRRVRDDE